MPTLQTNWHRVDGVTLVEAVVESDHETRVRIENRLDGPVWPPRRNGQPAGGWDEGGVRGDGRSGRPARGRVCHDCRPGGSAGHPRGRRRDARTDRP